MLWSKNQKIIYYYQIACQCFFFFFFNNVTTSTLRINPHQGRMLYFQLEVRCNHFSVKMYMKTKELGPIGGMRRKILLYPPMHDTN